jgi:Kef-type K+ transport system membrane component KefB
MGEGGTAFTTALDRVSLPVFVLFFSLAGASLDLAALALTWPLALCLAVIRAAAIWLAAWAAGALSGDPPQYNQTAWMAYLTQAGVAIGLAQLAMRKFPAIGTYLTTVVLAVICLNQIVGPIAFKMALHRVGETGRG